MIAERHETTSISTSTPDDQTAAAVQSHLDDCPGCLKSFDFERRLKVVVRRCLTEDMPETLESKVRELIRRETA